MATWQQSPFQQTALSCQSSPSPSPIPKLRGPLSHQRWLHNQFPVLFSVLHCPLGLSKLLGGPFLDIVFPILIFCLPCLLPLFTVPCKTVLANRLSSFSQSEHHKKYLCRKPEEWLPCLVHNLKQGNRVKDWWVLNQMFKTSKRLWHLIMSLQTKNAIHVWD